MGLNWKDLKKRSRAGFRGRYYNKGQQHPFYHIIYEHGNYYGPGWSGGKHQNSIDYKLDPNAPPPVDKQDYYAMIHDARYARVDRKYQGRGYKSAKFGDRDLVKADFDFAKNEFKAGGVRGYLGGLGVGFQGVLRAAAAPFTKQIKKKKYVIDYN